MKNKITFLIICSILFSFDAFCQFGSLKNEIAQVDSFNLNFPREKLFVHYDRPYYNLNDTVWLKGYIVSAKDFSANDSSKIAYIEIINSTGQLMKRVSTYCSAGTFYAALSLSEKDFSQGTYSLRAYTNYMRNYGDSLLFESRFKILDPNANDWKLAVDSINLSNNNFKFSGIIKSISGISADKRNVSILLRSKNKVLLKQNITTDHNGYIQIDTAFKKEITADSLQLELSNDNGLKIQLPVYTNEKQKIDLQFLPEGGHLIVNKLQQVGFKALNIFGKGIAVKGQIVNSKKEIVTNFQSIHNGMGSVWLKPELNQTYTAVLDNGLSFPFPTAKQSGTQLQITNNSASDSIEIMIDATPDLYFNTYFFRASSKGVSCAIGGINLQDKAYKLSISKAAFPSGICKFTLYDHNNLPVNERATLIWHRDTLQLDLVADKQFYNNKDSVHISLTATGADSISGIGSFSVAVIDTGLVQYSRNTENIISYLLLSSDLKGSIEEPAYYFGDPLPAATEALMLTQGWVDYDHFQLNRTFNYDTSFTINGKVEKIFNKPSSNTNLALLGKEGKTSVFFGDTKTDKDGNFTFNNFPLFTTDSVSLILRAVNKRGKPFGVGIEIAAPSFPSYKVSNDLFYENVFFDTTAKNSVKQQAKIYDRLKKEKGLLQEVVLTSRLKIRDSKNRNSDGGSDQVITTKILETMPKETLLDVLTQKVPGFYKGNLHKSFIKAYKRNGDLIIFVIDGYNINSAYNPISDSYTAFAEYEESYLKYITAEDVAGIEVMYSSKYRAAYEQYYSVPSTALLTLTFIEITTYSGHGAFDKKVPGMYLSKPLVPVVSKSFYSPRYSKSGNDNTTVDYRSTLYWNPAIITNEKGEAEFSFYTSDSKNGCLVIVQGTNMTGGLGVGYLPLFIKKE